MLIWGTGAYRADNVYLAYLSLDDEEVNAGLLSERGFERGTIPHVQYFAGSSGGRARWSSDEQDAVPLFFPAAIGELSVRWNATLAPWG